MADQSGLMQIVQKLMPPGGTGTSGNQYDQWFQQFMDQLMQGNAGADTTPMNQLATTSAPSMPAGPNAVGSNIQNQANEMLGGSPPTPDYTSPISSGPASQQPGGGSFVTGNMAGGATDIAPPPLPPIDTGGGTGGGGGGMPPTPGAGAAQSGLNNVGAGGPAYPTINVPQAAQVANIDQWIAGHPGQTHPDFLAASSARGVAGKQIQQAEGDYRQAVGNDPTKLVDSQGNPGKPGMNPAWLMSPQEYQRVKGALNPTFNAGDSSQTRTGSTYLRPGASGADPSDYVGAPPGMAAIWAAQVKSGRSGGNIGM